MTLLHTTLLGLTILICQSALLDIDNWTNLLDVMLHALPIIL